MTRLVLFCKPYGVLCQFRDNDGRATLANYIAIDNIYPAGRLDRDSEGLLLLTDDGKLQQLLTSPHFKQWKSYWVQVERRPEDAQLQRLRNGIELNDGPTLPAKVRLIEEPPLWPRSPPVRYRASIPTQWLEISIREGRNRQIRRMTAAIGHPTLRLVRHRIANWRLGQLKPGEWQLAKRSG